MVPERREGSGEDMFSQICRTRDDNGDYMSVEAIVDHMNFLMMAAHDTVTSSLTTLVWELARHPERSEEHTSELQSLMRSSYAGFCLKIKPPCTPPNKHHTPPVR